MDPCPACGGKAVRLEEPVRCGDAEAVMVRCERGHWWPVAWAPARTGPAEIEDAVRTMWEVSQRLALHGYVEAAQMMAEAAKRLPRLAARWRC